MSENPTIDANTQSGSEAGNPKPNGNEILENAGKPECSVPKREPLNSFWKRKEPKPSTLEPSSDDQTYRKAYPETYLRPWASDFYRNRLKIGGLFRNLGFISFMLCVIWMVVVAFYWGRMQNDELKSAKEVMKELIMHSKPSTVSSQPSSSPSSPLLPAPNAVMNHTSELNELAKLAFSRYQNAHGFYFWLSVSTFPVLVLLSIGFVLLQHEKRTAELSKIEKDKIAWMDTMLRLFDNLDDGVGNKHLPSDQKMLDELKYRRIEVLINNQPGCVKQHTQENIANNVDDKNPFIQSITELLNALTKAIGNK